MENGLTYNMARNNIYFLWVARFEETRKILNLFSPFSFVSTLCTLRGIGLISNQLERCLWWCSYAEFNQLKKEKIIRLQMNCKIA